MKIAFIGFGEAARAFVASLREHRALSFATFDILVGTREAGLLRKAAFELGVHVAETPAEAADRASWIFSAVTAADSLDAARSVGGLLDERQVFIDINSVSAARKREAAGIASRNGAAYVDMAVMAPVHPRGHRTPALLAGPACEGVADRMTALGFDLAIAGPVVGDATSIKMVRSLFVKGLEAVTVQALLAARAAGCLDAVHSSLSESFPQLGWTEFPRYQLERVAIHGVRRSAEMKESAATMGELGLPAGTALAVAIAGLQEEIGRLGLVLNPDDDLPAILDGMLAMLQAR
jgi:3-hydroxyisobutyrate dehydrogenase-like beta-hydroxyacid dehydrogenase